MVVPMQTLFLRFSLSDLVFHSLFPTSALPHHLTWLSWGTHHTPPHSWLYKVEMGETVLSKNPFWSTRNLWSWKTLFYILLRNSAVHRSKAEYLYLCLSFVCLSVPHRWHLHLSPLYDVLDQTNQIFSESKWLPLSTDPLTTYPSPTQTHQTQPTWPFLHLWRSSLFKPYFL